jgi:hypothetical protein
MGETHKVAAILVADIIGYSRLAGTDEDRTPSRLRAQRQYDNGPHRGARSPAREVHPRRTVAGILSPRSFANRVKSGAHRRKWGYNCTATSIEGWPVQPETRYADSGGVNIAYQVLGDGPRDLVFVMGWVSNIEVFGKNRRWRAS